MSHYGSSSDYSRDRDNNDRYGGRKIDERLDRSRERDGYNDRRGGDSRDNHDNRRGGKDYSRDDRGRGGYDDYRDNLDRNNKYNSRDNKDRDYDRNNREDIKCGNDSSNFSNSSRGRDERSYADRGRYGGEEQKKDRSRERDDRSSGDFDRGSKGNNSFDRNSGGGGRGEGSGVCYQFQNGQCQRGDSCKFSHDRGSSGGRGGGGRGDFNGRSGGRGDFGGRGAGGRGGRGNRHMGEVESINNLLSLQCMSDNAILSVINPPMAERDRSMYIDTNAPPGTSTSVVLPSHADWRFTNPVGKRLNGENEQVFTNHYHIDTSAIPPMIFGHSIHVFCVDKDDNTVSEDIAATEELTILASLILAVKKKNPQWDTSCMAYNGRSMAYTSRRLEFNSFNNEGLPHQEEIVSLTKSDGADSHKKYKVVITEVETFDAPVDWKQTSEISRVLNVLEISLSAFARYDLVSATPAWFLVGSKIFPSEGEFQKLGEIYSIRRGYYIGLKTCMAGLCFVADMNATLFLTGGEMINLMMSGGGYRNLDEFVRESQSRNGIPREILKKIEGVIKNTRIRIKYISFSRKAKSIGCSADSRDSLFEWNDKGQFTVADYFVEMCKTDPTYQHALPDGKLRYPSLPCINIGTIKKPVLIPPELIIIPGGQSRMGMCAGPNLAALIKYAAVKPQERFESLMGSQHVKGIASEISSSTVATAFGMNGISSVPMVVSATLLPNAKLQYGLDNFTGKEKMIDPRLTGTWRSEGVTFAKLPPNNDRGLLYGILIVSDREPYNWQSTVASFKKELEKDNKANGVNLILGGDPMNCSANIHQIKEKCNIMKTKGAVLVVCMMSDERSYGTIKLAADSIGLTSQCLKWKNIERPPKGYYYALATKINAKMGGTNHTLVSRASNIGSTVSNSWQSPPASISWLFDNPCMLVGMDVSHPPVGNKSESIAAIVASMDPSCSQYAAYITSQTSRKEMISETEQAFVHLLANFKERNNAMPSTIVIYRDGIGEGQFDDQLNSELPQIRSAIELCGYSADSVKIAVVICQKGHHTRFFFEEKSHGQSTKINACPGLVVDAMGGDASISSARILEFYLNSHVAIQGTCKPCKYSLIHDEIGLKLSEIELLTYWTTYLYSRCNKSVSFCTPAYYAHWAAKRGMSLYGAGGTKEDLQEISDIFSKVGRKSTMFFI